VIKLEYFDEAMKKYDAGKFKEAIGLLDTTLTINDNGKFGIWEVCVNIALESLVQVSKILKN